MRDVDVMVRCLCTTVSGWTGINGEITASETRVLYGGV
jgi:hypothetical protein